MHWGHKAGHWLVAAGSLALIIGFLGYGLTVLAITCVVLAGGLVAASLGQVRWGLGVAAATCAYHVFSYAQLGFALTTVLAMTLMTIGFAIAAFTAGRRVVHAAGYGIVALGNLWYVYENTFGVGGRGFALGNWIFEAGLVLIVVMVLRTSEPATTAPATAA